jgi:hypothetical protein
MLLGNEVRPIDVTMLVVEVLVLGLILLEVGLSVKDRVGAWRGNKMRLRLLSEDLDALNDSLGDSVRDHALLDRRPTEFVGSALFTGSRIEIVERDHTGWKWSDKNGELVKRWAVKRSKSRPPQSARI